MVSFRIIAALTSLVGLVAAAPSRIAERAPIQEFYLKTKVISGDPSKDALYVHGYHTGAGMNDIALSADTTNAAKSYLNGTNLQFDFNTTFPWGLSLAYTAYYTEWLPVEGNVGYGDGTYSINGSGLVSSNPEWTGWIVCDWYHGVPQLFWQFYYSTFPIPCSCARVELCAIDI